MAIRLQGDWEGWTKFFLKGLAELSHEATETAKIILRMKEDHSRIINSAIKNPANGLKLLERLFENPVVTCNSVATALGVSYPTANALVNEFCDLGILRFDPTVQRNKKYMYDPYVRLLQAGTEIGQ